MTRMPIEQLFREAEHLQGAGRPERAAELYGEWLAFNPESALLHAVYFNYAVCLAQSGNRAAAINALRECIRLKPDFYPPYINLGRLLEDCGQGGAAVTQWLAMVQRLSTITGEALRHKLLVLKQLGRVLEGAHLDGPAEEALQQSLDLKIEQPDVIQHWIALRMRQCKWPVLQAWDGAPVQALLANISPLSALTAYDDPVFHLSRAYCYARDAVSPAPAPSFEFRGHRHRSRERKLRIGYVSSDLREHAVGFGLAEVFELHDRRRYHISAYYCGIDRQDPTRSRIAANVDTWTDINSMSDDQAAAAIAQDEIDILIDVNGFTKDARLGLFARRPAPVIVNWFGYPGTMGTPYHNYIIADEFVIPQDQETCYSEKVLRLPCYQPNDRQRRVSEASITRAGEGLSEGAFVFCCFNGSQKILPPVFGVWMQILRSVPASVLWLLESTQETGARLRRAAEAEGVAGERLLFAPKRPNPEHLARYRLANLFLDTYPYGAHTTAADALWMGVPVLTIPGRSFASRVCADVVRAAGLSDLVCASASEYIAQAITLACAPAKLEALRARLRRSRDTSLLFDTPQLTRGLEELFDAMWVDFEQDRVPVPRLQNLGIYQDVGVAINLERDGAVPAPDLRAEYSARLARWQKTYALPGDGRLLAS